MSFGDDVHLEPLSAAFPSSTVARFSTGDLVTMLVWAACDNFALMMSDRRMLVGRVVMGASGETELGELAPADAAKSFASDDGRDVFALTGAPKHDWDPIEPVRNLHGVEADQALFWSVRSTSPLDEALDPNLLRLPNSILHAYRAEGRMICSKIDFGVGVHNWGILVAPMQKVSMVVDGSGAGYARSIVPADHAEWATMERNTDDWQAVRHYILRLFQAVTALDRAVGPDVDTWVMTKEDPVWRRHDAPERGGEP